MRTYGPFKFKSSGPYLFIHSPQSRTYLLLTQNQTMAKAIPHTIFTNSTSPKQANLKSLKSNNNSIIAQKLLSLTTSNQIDHALNLFHSTKKPDTFIWNTMIRGYTNCQLHEEAIKFYLNMLTSGLREDYFTFTFIIKSCIALSYYGLGLEVHGRLLKFGLDKDLYICNSLIVMYSKMGLISSAEQVFNEMGTRDVVSWNSMIDCYVYNSEEFKALSWFKNMLEEFEPDKFTLMSILEACSSIMSLKLGKEIHCSLIRKGHELSIKVIVCLLDMYSKCGNMDYAERLFDESMNTVAYNVMIHGYTLNRNPYKAVFHLTRMQKHGIDIDIDSVTLVNFLPACAELQNKMYVKEVHGAAFRRGLIPHTVLETELIDVYTKCDDMMSAELIFEHMVDKSLVTWNALITAYNQDKIALKLFLKLLQDDTLQPDEFTIASIIPAYAELKSLRHGKQIHCYAIKSGYEMNAFANNSLVNMYAKCGELQNAINLFDRMPLKNNVALWNAIIMAYGIHGLGKPALELFSNMIESGLQPDEITFVSLLSACSASGLVNEGWAHFELMQKEYELLPRIKHYKCMVDLLGRAGDLKKAVEFIEKMPLKPTEMIWGALLTASKNNNDIDVAEFAAGKIFEIEHDNTGCYVLLSNMYADLNRFEDVNRVRTLMEEHGLKHAIGQSIVELGSKTSNFINGDRSHNESYVIHEVLRILCKEERRETGKFINCSRHSVRLAVAYGLISSEIGKVVLVKKNVRICKPCHEVVKLISRGSRREIAVGDSKIYHHFKDGVCSCGDYW